MVFSDCEFEKTRKYLSIKLNLLFPLENQSAEISHYKNVF